jgi:hypothetical protein
MAVMGNSFRGSCCAEAATYHIGISRPSGQKIFAQIEVDVWHELKVGNGVHARTVRQVSK